MRNQISFVYGNPAVTPLVVGLPYSIGCVATQDISVGAINLEFKAPEGIKITKMTLKNGEEMAFHCVDEPEFPNVPFWKAGWFSKPDNPLELHAGEAFLTLEYELTEVLPIGTEIRFTMMDSPTVNFAGPFPEALQYYNQTIDMLLMVQGKTTISDRKQAQGYIGKPVYDTCSKCQMYADRRCGMGSFVVAKGGKCDYFE